VVGYEEGDVKITSALSTGYPRFVYHPYTVQLMQVAVERHGDPGRAQDCIVLPSKEAAARCQAFLRQALENEATTDNALISDQSDDNNTDPSDDATSDSKIRMVMVNDMVYAVLFPAQTSAGMEAKAYWQHTGEVVTSRRAEAALKSLNVPLRNRVTSGPEAPYVHHSSFQSCAAPDEALRSRIAAWSCVEDPECVVLAPSGMASIYTALRSARRYQMEQNNNPSGGASIVYGFPYLDTLKLCTRPELCPAGVEFFGYGDARDLENLERLLERSVSMPKKSFAALFTEVPSNPLLQCPDLFRLRELADTYNFCLVVDDTISNFLNVDVLSTGLADAVCTSLTKLVSGRGDAIAGSVVTNPNTERGRWMQQDLTRQSSRNSNNGLFCQDAHAILCNSTDFVERNAVINKNAECLADWLLAHPDVETVYYPKHSAPLYTKLMKENAGYGGLMSIILHPHMCQRTFYDALDVAKGPSLGTNFTLVCPYTLLAHYHELDFALSYNVAPNLLRIAVGLEPAEELIDKFDRALQQSRLYPKVGNCSFTMTQRRS
jgi:cystathionine gamma-synthase